MTPKQKWFLVCVVAIAVFFRLWLIWAMPGGLFPDEAANGLDINLMQQGHLQPFYERGNGREALFFYMEWASVAVFGKSPVAHHLTSALIGILSVLMAFLFTRRLFLMGEENPGDEKVKNKAYWIALLTSFLMAVSSWHVVLSRTAFRAIMIPLFSTLTLYFLLCIYQAKTTAKKMLFSFLFGAAFALGFYTYIAYRVMLPIIFVLIVWPWLANGFKQQIQNHWKKFIVFVFAFLIFIFPIAKYFITHPGSFVGRSGQVSVFNQNLYSDLGITEKYSAPPPLPVVLKVIGIVAKKSFLAYFTVGDLNWRQNVSGEPFISVLVNPFFGVGLLLVTFFALGYLFCPRKKQKWWRYFVLAVMFFAMLLPVISTAESIPHGLRSIGTIPAIFIISAWTLYEFGVLIYKLHQRLWAECVVKGYNHPFRYKLTTFGFKLVVVCFCLALILQTYFFYFVGAFNTPENFYAFRSDLTPISKYLVERCRKNNTYLILDKFSVQTTDYLTSDWHGNFNSPCNVPYVQQDPEDSWKLQNLTPQDEIVFTQSSIFDTTKFKQYHPTAWLHIQQTNKFGQIIMQVYKVK